MRPALPGSRLAASVRRGDLRSDPLWQCGAAGRDHAQFQCGHLWQDEWDSKRRHMRGTPMRLLINRRSAGGATILFGEGDAVEAYRIMIDRIDYEPKEKNKSFVFHVTDEKLIDQMGGIVQGMSGSPIIQEGRIIGAVTHVFINDPTKGYGIFIEEML